MPATKYRPSPNRSFLSPSTHSFKPKRSPPRLKRSKRFHMLRFCDIDEIPRSTPSIDPFQTPRQPLDFSKPLSPIHEAEPPIPSSSSSLSLEDWTPRTKRLVQLASPSPPPKKPISFKESLGAPMPHISFSLEDSMLYDG